MNSGSGLCTSNLLVLGYLMIMLVATGAISRARFIELTSKRRFATAFMINAHHPRHMSSRKMRQKPQLSFSSSPSNSSSVFKVNLEIPTPEDMEDVGAILSMGTVGGDVILLGGDLGAGKTCLSRGFVRARTGDFDMRVTSPTYLLSNTYQAQDVIIHHMDLYRLSGENYLGPLNMDHVFKNCISLIEWPSRLGKATPAERLEVHFKIDVDSEDEVESRTRFLTLKAFGAKWEDRLRLLLDEGYIDDLVVEVDVTTNRTK